MSNINAIIFDLGGVLLNIDFSKTQDELKKLGMKNPEKIFGQYSQIGLFDKLDKGEIDEITLFNEINSLLPNKVSEKDLLFAWNSMILDIPSERIKLLNELKKNYKIFLLSNTNYIHYKYYTNEIKKLGASSYEELFHKAYFSFKYKMRKPEKSFFVKVLDDNNLKPENTLFIDDTYIHIEKANKIGIKTHHLLNNDDVTMLFENGLLK